MYPVQCGFCGDLTLPGRRRLGSRQLGEAASSLERAGADFVVLCTNTMHKAADIIKSAIRIPLLHIADVTAEAISAAGIHTVGLLGTCYMMEQAFYRSAVETHGIDVLIPGEPQRTEVNRIIYEESCLGEIRDSSRDCYRQTIQELQNRERAALFLALRKSDC